MERNTRDSPPSPFWLRPQDQSVAAAITALALIAMGLWLVAGGHALVELDELPRRSVEYQVDINTAEWPELVVLPGIGPKLAQAIVQSRREKGPFRTIDDLRRVRGIGEKKLEQMRPYLLPIGSEQD
jgi:competence protein ComEA